MFPWNFSFECMSNLWVHIDGLSKKPTNKMELQMGNLWCTGAQIISRILGSIGPHKILNLRPDKTANDMWPYLNSIYHQENSARQFKFEFEIAVHTHKEKHQFKSGILDL